MNASLSQLVEMAKRVQMSEQQRAEQRNSFVYGNTKIENATITKEMVERVAPHGEQGACLRAPIRASSKSRTASGSSIAAWRWRHSTSREGILSPSVRA